MSFLLSNERAGERLCLGRARIFASAVRRRCGPRRRRAADRRGAQCAPVPERRRPAATDDPRLRGRRLSAERPARLRRSLASRARWSRPCSSRGAVGRACLTTRSVKTSDLRRGGSFGSRRPPTMGSWAPAMEPPRGRAGLAGAPTAWSYRSAARNAEPFGVPRPVTSS